MAKFYGVWIGRQPGVYDNWEDCKSQIDKFPHAKYRKLKSTILKDAIKEFQEDSDLLPVVSLNKPVGGNNMDNATQHSHERVLTVDGASNGLSCEFQAVWTDGQSAFSSKRFEGGTNNIAEFLGLVSAIKFLQENNMPLKVYTDSVTAMAWVRDKKANTTARITGKITKELEDMICAGEKWLKENSVIVEQCEILKWDTQNWGEIPADYGNK